MCSACLLHTGGRVGGMTGDSHSSFLASAWQSGPRRAFRRVLGLPGELRGSPLLLPPALSGSGYFTSWLYLNRFSRTVVPGLAFSFFSIGVHLLGNISKVPLRSKPCPVQSHPPREHSASALRSVAWGRGRHWGIQCSSGGLESACVPSGCRTPVTCGFPPLQHLPQQPVDLQQ